MYEFTDDMGEISGFGGGYEQTCRDMLKAGLEWLDEHPESDPCFKGYKNIYGVISADNEDAKRLSKAFVAVTDDCTGAMHQAVITSAMWIKKHSWEEYVVEMSKCNRDDSDSEAQREAEEGKS